MKLDLVAVFVIFLAVSASFIDIFYFPFSRVLSKRPSTGESYKEKVYIPSGSIEEITLVIFKCENGSLIYERVRFFEFNFTCVMNTSNWYLGYIEMLASGTPDPYFHFEGIDQSNSPYIYKYHIGSGFGWFSEPLYRGGDPIRDIWVAAEGEANLVRIKYFEPFFYGNGTVAFTICDFDWPSVSDPCSGGYLSFTVIWHDRAFDEGFLRPGFAKIVSTAKIEPTPYLITTINQVVNSTTITQ